jgi:hypothetical protein
MPEETIVLDVQERSAIEAAKRANAALDSVEKKAGAVVKSISGSTSGAAESMVRVTDRSRQSIERLVASVERKLAFAGKTGVDRLFAERDLMLKRVAGDDNAVRRISDAYGKMAAAERQVASSGFAQRVRSFVQNPLQEAGDAVGGVLEKLGTLGVVAGASVAAVAGLAVTTWNFAKSLAGMADQVEDTASRMGLTIREAEAFRFAMARAGGDLGQVELIMRELSREIDGGGKNLREMGVRYRDVRTGAVLPMAEVILNLSRRLKELPEGWERNSAGMKVMGRMALTVLPDLVELEEHLNRFYQLDVGLTPEQVTQFSGWQKHITDLEAAWEKLKISFKEKVVAMVTFGLPSDDDEAIVARAGAAREAMAMGRPSAYRWQGPRFSAEEMQTERDRQAESIRRNDAAVAARLASTAEERLVQAKAKLADLRKDLATGVEYRADRFRDFDAQKRIVAGIEAEVEATKKLVEARKPLVIQSEAVYKANETPRRMVPSLYGSRGAGMGWSDSLVVSAEAMAAANAGSNAAAAAQLRARLEGSGASETRRRERSESLAAQELEHRVRIVELTAGPGGELAAVDRIYQLRRASAKTQEEAQSAALDHERRIAEVAKERLDSLKSSMEGLIDAAFTRAQSLGQAVAGMLRAMILTPFKEALSTIAAKALMPIMWGKDGRGGLLGGLLGVFRTDSPLKLSTDVNTVATDRNTLAIERLNARLGVGAGAAPGAGVLTQAAGLGMMMGGLVAGSRVVGGEVIGAGRVASAGLERLPSGLYARGGIPVAQLPVDPATGQIAASSRYAGMIQGAALMGGSMLTAGGIQRGNAGLTIGGGAAMGYGLAGQLGMTGYGGAIMGAGAGLAVAGLQRGGWAGVGMSTAGGALVGLQFGGPLGAAIGAGVGFVAGLIRLGIKGAQEKAREKIQQLYGVRIQDKGVLRQVVEMAKSGFGGNLDMAIRSPQVRELVELYAQTTGQRMPLEDRVRAVSLLGAGGGLYQAPMYQNGSAYAFAGSVPALGASSLDTIGAGRMAPVEVHVYQQLPADQVRDFMEGRIVETVATVPAGKRAVATASAANAAGSRGRRESAVISMHPSLVTG